jgi:hypothetical protein
LLELGQCVYKGDNRARHRLQGRHPGLETTAPSASRTRPSCHTPRRTWATSASSASAPPGPSARAPTGATTGPPLVLGPSPLPRSAG